MQPIERFRLDWSGDAQIAHLCEELYRYLADSSNHLEHFSFAQLKAVVSSTDEAKIAQALQYLSSSKWRIFHQSFTYFDGDEMYEFSPEEMHEFFSAGAFPHPVSGHIINDLNEIIVIFEVGDFFDHRVQP